MIMSTETNNARINHRGHEVNTMGGFSQQGEAGHSLPTSMTVGKPLI